MLILSGSWTVQLYFYFSVYTNVIILGDSLGDNLNAIHSLNSYPLITGEEFFSCFSSTIVSGTKLFQTRVRTNPALILLNL